MIVELCGVNSIVGGLLLIARHDPSGPQFSLAIARFIANSHDVEPPSITARRPCPIDVCIDVNLLLFELNSAIINCKSMPAKELSPGRGLDCKAQSCIQRKAGGDEEHLVVVRLQMESTGEVAAVVIARIERKPEGLGFGDEF